MRLSRGTPLLAIFFLAGLGCHEIVEQTGPSHDPMVTHVAVVGAAPLTGAPNPDPTPTPGSTPNPSPTPTPPPGGNLPVNRVVIKVMFVVCNNEGVPNSEGMTNVAVGCKVHLDLNAKDVNNKPTEPKGLPEWSYDKLELVEVHEDTYTPYVVAKAAGTLRVTATLDDVDSNELLLHFQ
jgi:hypothetical protein